MVLLLPQKRTLLSFMYRRETLQNASRIPGSCWTINDYWLLGNRHCSIDCLATGTMIDVGCRCRMPMSDCSKEAVCRSCLLQFISAQLLSPCWVAWKKQQKWIGKCPNLFVSEESERGLVLLFLLCLYLCSERLGLIQLMPRCSKRLCNDDTYNTQSAWSQQEEFRSSSMPQYDRLEKREFSISTVNTLSSPASTCEKNIDVSNIVGKYPKEASVPTSGSIVQRKRLPPFSCPL